MSYTVLVTMANVGNENTGDMPIAVIPCANEAEAIEQFKYVADGHGMIVTDNDVDNGYIDDEELVTVYWIANITANEHLDYMKEIA